jgi:tetratricopeptide (TPR) repeat protein
MIDLNSTHRLIDLIRQKDWPSAHSILDKAEMTDPGESNIAYWRAVVLRDEGRHDDALCYLADNLGRFTCKTNAFHQCAWILHELGNDKAALAEIEKAPLDSEIEDYWALVMEAKFFRLYLMAKNNLSLSEDQMSEIPDDYISLMPGGNRISKAQLKKMSGRS